MVIEEVEEMSDEEESHVSKFMLFLVETAQIFFQSTSCNLYLKTRLFL